MATARTDRRSDARTGCVSRLEVEGVEETALERGRLTYITPAHDPAHAKADAQLPRRRQGVHDESVQFHEIHAVRDERHVLTADVVSAQRALLRERNRNAQASALLAGGHGGIAPARHGHFIAQ